MWQSFDFVAVTLVVTISVSAKEAMLTDLTHHRQLQGVIKQGLEGRAASQAASDIRAKLGVGLGSWHLEVSLLPREAQGTR